MVSSERQSEDRVTLADLRVRVSRALRPFLSRFRAEIEDSAFLKSLPADRPARIGVVEGEECTWALVRVPKSLGKLLNERERQVTIGVFDDLPDKGIAQRLSPSRATVRDYLGRIFAKLGIRSRLRLSLLALGLLAEEDGKSPVIP